MFNETGSPQFRELVRKAGAIYTSLWAFAEFPAVVHRRKREDSSLHSQALNLAACFAAHVEEGLWNLIPCQ